MLVADMAIRPMPTSKGKRQGVVRNENRASGAQQGQDVHARSWLRGTAKEGDRAEVVCVWRNRDSLLAPWRTPDASAMCRVFWSPIDRMRTNFLKRFLRRLRHAFRWSEMRAWRYESCRRCGSCYRLPVGWRQEVWNKINEGPRGCLCVDCALVLAEQKGVTITIEDILRMGVFNGRKGEEGCVFRIIDGPLDSQSLTTERNHS